MSNASTRSPLVITLRQIRGTINTKPLQCIWIASDMDCHISVVDHKTTRLCIALSAHGSTRAKCIRSNGRIQIRSNTKDARTGRNTNTSILIATDMHATETLNQQWETTSSCMLHNHRSNVYISLAYRVSSSRTSWRSYESNIDRTSIAHRLTLYWKYLKHLPNSYWKSFGDMYR